MGARGSVHGFEGVVRFVRCGGFGKFERFYGFKEV
jgi:hypothetical protein